MRKLVPITTASPWPGLTARIPGPGGHGPEVSSWIVWSRGLTTTTPVSLILASDDSRGAGPVTTR